MRASSGNRAAGGAPARGKLAAIGVLPARVTFGNRPHLDHGRPGVEPAARRIANLGRARVLATLEAAPVRIRAPAQDLALGEHVGLAAEAADLFDAAQEAGALLRLHALQLRARGAVRDEAGDLLVERPLERGEILARLRRHLDDEESADLAQPRIRLDLRCDLLLAHEPPIAAARSCRPRARTPPA